MNDVLQYPCTPIVQTEKVGGVFRAVTLKDSIWKSGSKGNITITFGESFCRGCSKDAAWSLVGNNSNKQNPSMNLGYIDPPFGSFTFAGKVYQVPNSAKRNNCGKTKESCKTGWVPGTTVIHEFCHSLGMLHEHQNNLEKSNPIILNKPDVYKYYNCIGMGKDAAEVNVIDTYFCKPGDVNCEYEGTVYDKESIMLYGIPDAWVQGCEPYKGNNCLGVSKYISTGCSNNSTKVNFVLSKKDIEWLTKKYPKDAKKYPELTVRFVDRNPEEWKTAWVQKIVTETFEPLIGVKWIFINGVKINNESPKEKSTSTTKSTSVVSKSTSVVSKPTSVVSKPTSMNSGPVIENTTQNNSSDNGAIAGIVIGSIIGILFLIFIFYKLIMLIKLSSRH